MEYGLNKIVCRSELFPDLRLSLFNMHSKASDIQQCLLEVQKLCLKDLAVEENHVKDCENPQCINNRFGEESQGGGEGHHGVTSSIARV